MFIMDKKLKILKSKLKDWHKTSFRNVQQEVKDVEANLEDIQKKIDYGMTNMLQDQEKKAQVELNLALNLGETLCRKILELNGA